MNRFAGSIIVGAMVLARPVAAQANVSIDATAKDNLGRQLVAQVRQKVASSPLMTYISDDNKASLKLRLVTLNPDHDDPSQNQTIYAQVIVLHPINDGLETYLTSSVGNCGSNKIDQCASSIVADLDEWVEAIRKTSNK